jgi:hypothetical protein
VADTERWMREHGITQDQIEDHLAIEARGRKLRAVVAEASAEGPPAAYFQRHRGELEILRVARVQVDDRDDAHRVAERARGGRGLLAIAEDRFVATGRDELRLVSLRAGDLPPDQAAVRAAAPGDVLAPAPAGGGWEVVQLLARVPARYDADTEELIAERLFQRWLEHELAQVRVEWFWGAAG